MYALALIVILGILATLIPFAVLPSPRTPAVSIPSPQTPLPKEDAFRKENIEQFIISACNIRKTDGKADIYPACVSTSGCSTAVLTYSDGDIHTEDLVGVGNFRKSDGNPFMVKAITLRTCDASDFVF